MSTAASSTFAGPVRASTAAPRTDSAEECISAMKRNGIDLTNADTYDWVLTIPKDELRRQP